MKRFILLLGFILLSVGFANPQRQMQEQSNKYVDWVIENQNDWGSFYWSVTQHFDGKAYIYQVYLYSNSYFQTKRNGVDHDRATTHIRNLKVTMVEVDRYGKAYHSVPILIPVATADYTLSKPVAFFWSQNRLNRFQVTYEAVSPFDYSRY